MLVQQALLPKTNKFQSLPAVAVSLTAHCAWLFKLGKANFAMRIWGELLGAGSHGAVVIAKLF
jgi:hypothetical protein